MDENLAFISNPHKFYNSFLRSKQKMPLVVTLAFKAWLKANSNMKLSSDAAVTRLTYEGITNMESLIDFDKKSIESLPNTCKERGWSERVCVNEKKKRGGRII